MFWILFLAHLLGDYPLQPDRLVAIKTTGRGLALHVAIHLAALLALSAPTVDVLAPWLLMLAGLRAAIDMLKNGLNRLWPRHRRATCALDRGLHLFSRLLTARLATSGTAGSP